MLSYSLAVADNDATLLQKLLLGTGWCIRCLVLFWSHFAVVAGMCGQTGSDDIKYTQRYVRDAYKQDSAAQKTHSVRLLRRRCLVLLRSLAILVNFPTVCTNNTQVSDAQNSMCPQMSSKSLIWLPLCHNTRNKSSKYSSVLNAVIAELGSVSC